MRSSFAKSLFHAAALLTGTALAGAAPVEVRVSETEGVQLLRDGQPYLVKGAGGNGPLDLLAE